MRTLFHHSVRFWAVLALVAGVAMVNCHKKHSPAPAHPADGTALDFWMQLVDGRIFNASDVYGFVVLINFWDTWCGPCRYEQPDLNKLHTEYHDDGLEILGIALAHDGIPAVAEYLTEFGVEYTSGVIGPGVTELHGTPASIPFTLIIDRSGEIRHELTGSRTFAAFEELITPLLTE